jgi:UrcA family protein
MDEAAKSIDSADSQAPSPQPTRTDAATAQSVFLTSQEISMNTMTTMTTSRSFRGLLAAAVLSAFACSLSTMCTAAEPTVPPQTTVKFADLKVSSPDGAVALYGRIQRAARQVCDRFDGGDLSSKVRMDTCVQKAIADAVAKVDQPALFTVYNAHNGQPTPIVLAATR